MKTTSIKGKPGPSAIETSPVPKDDTQYFIKESALEELYETREPVLMGHYKGDAVYAAIFSTMEEKYPLTADD